MKAIITLIAILLSIASYGQNKSEVIYNNGTTHDNICADIFNNDTTYIYSVTTAAMWSGKLSTKIVYKGNHDQFLSFMTQLLRFAETNKDNKGAKIVIDNINIESTKKMGIKCISIGTGKDVSNTTYSSIKNALNALSSWERKIN